MKSEFFEVCGNATPARGSYVSLYISVPYYGGPEEGGWWGRDSHLVAYEWFPTEEQANAARDRVRKMADDKSAEAKRNYGDQCLAECEWLDARGLDANFLPEPAGSDEYWVATEDEAGSMVETGSRHSE